MNRSVAVTTEFYREDTKYTATVTASPERIDPPGYEDFTGLPFDTNCRPQPTKGFKPGSDAYRTRPRRDEILYEITGTPEDASSPSHYIGFLGCAPETTRNQRRTIQEVKWIPDGYRYDAPLRTAVRDLGATETETLVDAFHAVEDRARARPDQSPLLRTANNLLGDFLSKTTLSLPMLSAPKEKQGLVDFMAYLREKRQLGERYWTS